MRKTLATVALAGFIVLLTAGFGLAESAAGVQNFPYFHLGALLIGGLVIVSLRMKYEGIYMTEAMGAFALYTVLITIFTAPVVEMIRALVG